MPGTFVIDRQGVIRYAHRNRDVSDNPSNQEILDALEPLASPRRASPKEEDVTP
jgi:peroxiredoxin